MPCIGPDGKPTESGTKILRALEKGPKSDVEIVLSTGMPLFRVRSGCRQLAEAGYASQEDDRYRITEKGADILG